MDKKEYRHWLGQSLMGKEYTTSLKENGGTFYHYLYMLLELAISRFKWELPDGCNERFLELGLCGMGISVFLYDDDMEEYQTLHVTPEGNYNEYGEPMVRMAYGYNGSQTTVDETNSVLVYNNYLWRPIYDDLVMYAKRLSELDVTVDVNSINQRSPIVAVGDMKSKLTVTNFIKQFMGGVPFIQVKNKFEKDNISTLDLSSHFVADKIYEMKTKIWNEALQFLGIANMSINKQERMITDEVQRSMGGAFAMRNTALITRMQACDKINAKFGLNVSVKWNEDLNSNLEETGEEKSEGVEEDGRIHTTVRAYSPRTGNR